jgi:hypothetical protein
MERQQVRPVPAVSGYEMKGCAVLWVAMAPLLLLGLAVGLVPVTMGMVHDHRARRAGLEHADQFFLPPRRGAGEPKAKLEPSEGDGELNVRLERIEATLAQVLARVDGQTVSAAPEGT